MKSLHSKQKNKPVWLVILFDVLLVGVTLILYALVHHVIPSYKERFSEHETVAPIATAVISTPAPEATPEPEIPWKEKFADKFTDEVVRTADSYKSPNVSVEIIETIDGMLNDPERQVYYVADIYIADIECFQTSYFGGAFGTSCNYIGNIAEDCDAVVAVNGDFSSTASGGYIIRNGNLYRNSYIDAEICVLYRDGTMKTYLPEEFDAQEALENGAWQAWTFGPSLLDENGAAKTSFSQSYGTILSTNPRTVLGYYEPGHYCFVVIEGRDPGFALGYNMNETAELMEKLGCKVAFNLDGGDSSKMILGVVPVTSAKSMIRDINDIVCIVDAKED